MNTSESINNISVALVKASSEMPKIPFNKVNPHFGSKYADLSIIIELTKPVLRKFGLAIVQTCFSGHDEYGVRTMVIHESGEFIEDYIGLPLPTETKQNIAQVFGQYNTYLRRYSWVSICGIFAEEDDDGNSSTINNKPNILASNKSVSAESKPIIRPQSIPFADDEEVTIDLDYLEDTITDNDVNDIIFKIQASQNNKKAASEKQVNLLGMLLHQQIHDEELYQEVLTMIGGKPSVKAFQGTLVTAIIDWLKPYKDETGKFKINKDSLKELQKITLEAVKNIKPIE